MNETVLTRFLRYVSFDTQSARESETAPSTEKQLRLAETLVAELKELGVENAHIGNGGVVYALVPATKGCEDCPTIGFIAHMDTSPDASGENVKPQILRYEGGDVTLNAEKGIVFKAADFPEITKYQGEDVIFTDGTTLLGADDKAGVAAVMAMVAHMQAHPETPHAALAIGFTPDEEVARGTVNFDIEHFGASYAYTFDGGEVGTFENENFNAGTAIVTVKGVGVHPGLAKDKMVNANRLAAEFATMLPEDETPETTEAYEGFYHLLGIQANIENATLHYIIRDHDRERFEDRKDFIEDCVRRMNDKYGNGTVTAELKDQYYNMKEKIDPNMHVIDIVLKAMQDCGVPPKVEPIRGGTDGAQLSFKGLPCPNIFAGGVNFHGPYEFVSIQVMEKAMQVIVRICELTAQYND